MFLNSSLIAALPVVACVMGKGSQYQRRTSRVSAGERRLFPFRASRCFIEYLSTVVLYLLVSTTQSLVMIAVGSFMKINGYCLRFLPVRLWRSRYSGEVGPVIPWEDFGINIRAGITERDVVSIVPKLHMLPHLSQRARWSHFFCSITGTPSSRIRVSNVRYKRKAHYLFW